MPRRRPRPAPPQEKMSCNMGALDDPGVLDVELREPLGKGGLNAVGHDDGLSCGIRRLELTRDSALPDRHFGHLPMGQCLFELALGDRYHYMPSRLTGRAKDDPSGWFRAGKVRTRSCAGRSQPKIR